MILKLLADENIPIEAVFQLRRSGIDIDSVSLLKPGADDESVLAMARAQQRVLVTFDNDFGKLVFRLKLPCSGVILIRLHPQSPGQVAGLLHRVLAKDITFQKSFCVVEAERMRVIPL